ncbi:MAG: hypothetical protein AVDCRST_MAG25-1083, partial [uncultured Rubrobacteraceae bacterium]
ELGFSWGAGHEPRAPLDHQDATPAGGARLGDPVPADVLRDKRQRADRGDAPARLPDRLVPRLRVRVPARAGGALRGDHRRLRPRARHRERVLRPALPDADAPLGPPARDADGGRGPRAYSGRGLSGSRPALRGEHPVRYPRYVRPDPLYRARLPRVRRYRGDAGAQNGFGRGRRERVPAVLRLDLYEQHQPAARPHRAGLVPVYSDGQPDLIPRRGDTEPRDHGLGHPGPLRRLRVRPGAYSALHLGGLGLPARAGGTM